MHRLTYKVTTLAPLVISARYGDNNMVSTLHHIPGTSVLGMMAYRFIRSASLSDDASQNKEFRNAFLDGNIIFGNAFPCFEDKRKKEHIHFPVPFSIRKEKGGGQIYDLLISDDDPETQTESVNGFCHIEGGKRIHIQDVETGLNFHHSRDSETGTSKEGMIFNYESLSPGQTFKGDIIGSKDDLIDLIKRCGKERNGYIGRSRNSQYGKVHFEFVDAKPVPMKESPTDEMENKVALTLHSDTIVYNENGFSTTDTKILADILGAKIKKAFVKVGEVENFVGVWRLKKPSETCFQAGSCFLLDISDVSDGGKKRLAEFQRSGIGERIHEGFGQCVFEWQQEEKLNENKKAFEKPAADQPDFPMPEKTKEILRTVVRDEVLKIARTNAMRDAGEFKKHRPSNALLGKLQAMASDLKPDEFISEIGKFRKTAKEQMRKCRTNNRILSDFIEYKNNEMQAENFFDRSTDFDKLVPVTKESGYSLTEDTQFRKEISQAYFTSFFSAMRKSEAEGGR